MSIIDIDDGKDICTDEEIRDFLVNNLGLTPDDMKQYIEKEQQFLAQGSIAPDLFPTPEEIQQIFRVMRSIVEGKPISDPISDYDRAMGII